MPVPYRRSGQPPEKETDHEHRGDGERGLLLFVLALVLFGVAGMFLMSA